MLSLLIYFINDFVDTGAVNVYYIIRDDRFRSMWNRHLDDVFTRAYIEVTSKGVLGSTVLSNEMRILQLTDGILKKTQYLIKVTREGYANVLKSKNIQIFGNDEKEKFIQMKREYEILEIRSRITNIKTGVNLKWQEKTVKYRSIPPYIKINFSRLDFKKRYVMRNIELLLEKMDSNPPNLPNFTILNRKLPPIASYSVLRSADRMSRNRGDELIHAINTIVNAENDLDGLGNVYVKRFLIDVYYKLILYYKGGGKTVVDKFSGFQTKNELISKIYTLLRYGPLIGSMSGDE